MTTAQRANPSLTLTAAQRDAIERTDLSLAVTSGAGCGKTFVLTRRYLQHLHDDGLPDAPTRIVAVTFTEKAALEMRQRVGRLLSDQLAAAPDDAGRALLGEWLRRLPAARITTIHGFCAALLRAHAVVAGVDPDFAVLADPFQVRQMVDRACSDAPLGALAAGDEAVAELIEAVPLDKVVAFLGELADERWRWSAADYADPAATLRRWAGQARVAEQVAWDALDLDALRTEMRALAAVPCNDPDDKLAVHRATQLASLALLLDDPASRTPQRFADLHPRPGNIGSARTWGGREAVADLRRRLKALLATVEPLGELAAPLNESDERAARHLAALTRLADDAVRRYAAAKRRGGWLDFVDLLVGARDLLRDNAEVRRRTAADVGRLLIDEFQDTDSLQRELLWLAAGCEGLAPPPGRVFFVGDAQQSIYRFRGAEVEVFAEVRDALGADNRRRLDLNFRTHAPGIALVNRLFGPLMGPAFEPLRAHRAEPPPAPAAEILLAACPQEKPSAADRARSEAGVLAQRVAELLADGQPRVWDDRAAAWRPARPGDVAILFRRLTNTAPYEEALADAGVPFYVVAGAGLYRQQEVYDLANALRAIDNPLDDVALAGFLRGGMVGLDDNALLHVARTLEPPYRPGLGDERLAAALPPGAHQRLAWAADVLDRLAARKDALGLDALIEALLAETGFEAALLGTPYGLRKCGNVHRVLDQARQAQSAGATLRQFVEYLSTLTVEQVRAEQAAVEAEEDDVVRLMTIHKAKGLEFPVVFLADLNYSPRDRSGMLGVRGPLGLTLNLPPADEETPASQSAVVAARIDRLHAEAEDLRSFYVAVTRHRDYLAFVGALEQTKDSQLGRAGSDLRRLDEALGLGGCLEAGEIALGEGLTVPVAVEQAEPGRGEAKPSILDDLLAQADGPEALAELLSAEPPQPTTTESLPFLAPAAGAGVERLAPTALSELEFCPTCFRWHYELRVPAGMLGGADKTAREPSDRGALDAASTGTVFHRCMELLDFANPQDAAALIRQTLEEERLDVDPAGLVADLETMLARFRQHPLWAELAGARRRLAELEFVTRVGRLELTGKIDLLVQNAAGQWRIIDYKSDRVAGEHLAAHAARYNLQMQSYSLAARRYLRSAEPIPATLYFLRPGLTFEWDAAAMAEPLEDRVARLVEQLADCRRTGRWPARGDDACRHCHYAALCGKT